VLCRGHFPWSDRRCAIQWERPFQSGYLPRATVYYVCRRWVEAAACSNDDRRSRRPVDRFILTNATHRTEPATNRSRGITRGENVHSACRSRLCRGCFPVFGRRCETRLTGLLPPGTLKLLRYHRSWFARTFSARSRCWSAWTSSIMRPPANSTANRRPSHDMT